MMFNYKYGLTQAVLEGRKTMTRRIIDSETLSGANDYVQRIHGTGLDFLDYLLEHSRYKVGEVVAVAQSYRAIHEEMWCNDTDTEENMRPYFEHFEDAGYDNKMFVLAELMPHQIRITAVRIERLQDISDEDCLREGGMSKNRRPQKPDAILWFQGHAEIMVLSTRSLRRAH